MKKLLFILMSFSLFLVGCQKEEVQDVKLDVNTGKQQLVVAMDLSSAPYGFESISQNEDTYAYGSIGYAMGYDVWFVEQLAKSMNKELVIRNKRPQDFKNAFEKDEIDLAMGGLLARKDDGLLYSNVYYPSCVAMVVLKDSKQAAFKSLEQFKAMKIGAVEETYFADIIQEIPKAKKVKGILDTSALLASLKDKKTDAILLDNNCAQLMLKMDASLQIIQFDKNQGFAPVTGVSICSDNSKLMKKVNKYLKKLTLDTETMNKAMTLAPKYIKK